MRRPSPALVISCVALLVALGGTGYATVLQVPRNSVGTLQLQRNAVKASKIAPNAIRTGHVLDGGLLAADFKPGQLPAGPRGDKGEKGDKGDKGATGSPGISAHEFLQSAATSVAPNVSGFATATCPAGKRVLGGGGHIAGAVQGAGFLWQSIPLSNTEWRVAYKNTSAANVSIWAYAVCATVAS